MSIMVGVRWILAPGYPTSSEADTPTYILCTQWVAVISSCEFLYDLPVTHDWASIGRLSTYLLLPRNSPGCSSKVTKTRLMLRLTQGLGFIVGRCCPFAVADLSHISTPDLPDFRRITPLQSQIRIPILPL